MGMQASHVCPPILHLFFADDSIFVCQAKTREGEEVMIAIKIHGKTSGQCINFESSPTL